MTPADLAIQLDAIAHALRTEMHPANDDAVGLRWQAVFAEAALCLRDDDRGRMAAMSGSMMPWPGYGGLGTPERVSWATFVERAAIELRKPMSAPIDLFADFGAPTVAPEVVVAPDLFADFDCAAIASPAAQRPAASASIGARSPIGSEWRRSHPRVWNRRDPAVPEGAVYVGRGGGSTLGNPFSHLDGTTAEHRVASRDDAITAFLGYAEERGRMDPAFRSEVKALDGRDVVCWCAPHSCHGEVLLALAARWIEEDGLAKGDPEPVVIEPGADRDRSARPSAPEHAGEPLAFNCPRCGNPAMGRFYGVCGSCSAELAEAFTGVQGEAVEVEYDPKMNVTPNAVALKD